MEEWRITFERPLREYGRLDWERCAGLHNHILEQGWTQRGLALEDLDRLPWWKCYGGNEALVDRFNWLDPSLVSFLKAAWHEYAMDPTTPHDFHLYLTRLCSPEELLSNYNYADDETPQNKRRYITLYAANPDLGAHGPLGLVFDQDAALAMQHMSYFDAIITMNGRQTWLPLEVILHALAEMITEKKITAVTVDIMGRWIMHAYTESDLFLALDAFDKLVEAIEARMPFQADNVDRDMIDLVSGGNPGILPPSSFAYRFLTECARPSFSYIAPGLRVATYQPFAPASGQVQNNTLYPVLLFSSMLNAYRKISVGQQGEQTRISPVSHDIDCLSSYPAGLYLTDADFESIHPFGDGSKLMLPFCIGSNGFAQTGDGTLIGENVRWRGSDYRDDLISRSSALYQQGYNQFIAAHDVQLHFILRSWLKMVEGGKWKVDEDGVMGFIEDWEEADTAENWEYYQLPAN